MIIQIDHHNVEMFMAALPLTLPRQVFLEDNSKMHETEHKFMFANATLEVLENLIDE
jgi:hypothetical protein